MQILTRLCQRSSGIAPGTILRLAPGARLWLSTATGKQQVVCQSHADDFLTLLVDRPAPPWISSKSLQSCHRRQRRMSCVGRRDGNKVLVCVQAKLEKSTPQYSPQEAASLVLRSLPRTPDTTLEDKASREKVLGELQQAASLCHELYQIGQKFTLTWTVDSTGKVSTIEPPPSLPQSHPRLSSCLMDVIRDFDYPRSPHPVTLAAPL